LGVLGELFLAAHVLHGGIVDCKARDEHGGCEFAAISAVADEGKQEVRTLYWL